MGLPPKPSSKLKGLGSTNLRSNAENSLNTNFNFNLTHENLPSDDQTYRQIHQPDNNQSTLQVQPEHQLTKKEAIYRLKIEDDSGSQAQPTSPVVQHQYVDRAEQLRRVNYCRPLLFENRSGKRSYDLFKSLKWHSKLYDHKVKNLGFNRESRYLLA